MKKLLIVVLLCFALLTPTTSFGETLYSDRSNDWRLTVFTDNTGEVVSCLETKHYGRFGKPGIALFFTSTDKGFISATISGKGKGLFNGTIKGNRITYSVDKGPYITLDSLDKEDLNRLVKDFKAGSKVIYIIHSDNEYINDAVSSVSLKGFSILYNKAMGYKVVEECYEYNNGNWEMDD